MLRKIRITLAAVMMVMITLLFLDVSGTLHHYLAWTARIQFLPALLALNVVVIVALVLLTLIFGRIYCSVICPLGIFQDIVSWIRGKSKKNRFTASPEKRWLRYGVLALFVIAFIAGVHSLVALLAPYSSYGRMVTNLLLPVYQWGNNLLASIAERVDSYAFYGVPYRPGDLHHYRGAGMAWRTHLLQYHLPRGHYPCPVGAILVAEGLFRCRQVQVVQPVYQELQGVVYRLQDP